MTVAIHLIGLTPRGEPIVPNDEGWYTLESLKGETIETILDQFGLKNTLMVILKNGIRAREDDRVKDGDEIKLLPMVPGG